MSKLDHSRHFARATLVFPDERTFSEGVGMSQTCPDCVAKLPC
jgi:hypothetical protein